MKTSILRTAVLVAGVAINLFAMCTVARAQTETTRDPNTTSLGIASSSHLITAVLPLPDGRTLLAVKGTITGAADSSAAFSSYGIATLGTDGVVTAADAGNFDKEITALHRLPDGKILVAGQFTSIGGSPVLTNGKSRLARLNADFSLDTTFVPTPKSSTKDGLINALAVDDQGRIYVGGTFTDYGGEADRDSLVRLFPDGMLDRSFVRAPVSGSSVTAILRQNDGKIVVAGSFTELSGDSLAVPGIYRLEADGSLDLDFNPQVNSGASQFSHAVLDAEQRIVVAQTNPARTVYRLLPTGVKDLSFVGPTSFASTINAVVSLPGNRVLVGGLFTTVTVGATSQSAARLIRLSENGDLDATYSPGASLTGSGTFGVTKAAVAANGRVYLAGSFTGYAAASANRVLVLEGSAPALAFTAQPQGAAEVAGASATFRASATGQNSFTFAWFKDGAPLIDDGRIAGSSTDTLTISNLTPDDAADYTVVVTMSASPSSVSITSDTAPLAVISTPEIITAPVDTTVSIYGTATLSVLARGGPPLSYQWLFDGEEIDGANSATLLIEDAEFTDGGRYTVRVSNTYGADTSDAVFLTVERMPGAVAADVPALSANGEVHAILKLQDGSILVGGAFTTLTVDGVDHPRKYIARFLSSGALDGGFSPSFSAPVRALAQDSIGIYVGGDFANVTFGTTTTNYRRVLRLTSGLVLDTTFNGTLNITQAGSVYALAPVGDGSIFVGGNFNAFAEAENTARVARLTATGAVHPSFTSGFATDAPGSVNALVYASSALFVGGDIDVWADTTDSARLLKLSPSGTPGTRLSFPAPDTTVTVNELLVTDGLGLVVGGRSGSAGSPTAYLKRFDLHTGAPTSMESGLTSNTDVRALASQSDNLLLVGASAKLARLNASAEPVDSSFEDSVGSFRALAVDNSGRIWAGGTTAPRLVVLAGGTPYSSSGSHTPQTVELAAINGGAYDPDNNTRTLVATASSGLTSFTYSFEGPATVHDNVLTILGSGFITVTATQTGDSTYASASASRTFAVTKATQEITFPAIAKRRVSSPPFELQATTSAPGLSVRYVVEEGSPATVVGRTLTLNGTPGTVVVTAYEDGDNRFRPANPKKQEFIVEDIERLEQRITFSQPPARVFGSAPAKVNVSTNAPGLTVTLEVIEGQAFGSLGGDNRTLTVTGAGTIKIRATEAGNENYQAAAPVTRDLIVNKASQRITFTVPGALVLGDTPPPLAATASSGLTVSYALGTGSNAATLSDGALAVTGAGKIVVVASQAGDANFLPAASVTRTIVVSTPKLVLSGLVRTYTGEAQGVTVTGAPEAYKDEVKVTYQLGTTPATEQEPTAAGTYRVVATLGEGARTTGTFKINKKVLTVTPQNKTLLVGTTIPTGAAAIDFFPVTYSGFVEGEGENLIATKPIPYTTAKATSNAGTSYKILARGGLDENYSFVYVPGNLTLVGLAGGYEAMVVDGDGRKIGRLSLTMLRNSFGYTGSLTLAAEAAPVTLRSVAPNTPLTGEFVGSAARASGTWARSASGSLPALALTMSVGSDGTLTGSLSRGGQLFGLLSEGRLLRTGSTGASGVGTYSLLLAPTGNQSTAPEGVGHVKATITSSGLMLLNGKLADGTILSGSAKVDTANSYRVFLKPYGKSRLNNAVGGVFQLAPSVIGAFRVDSAAVTWLKPASSTDKSYRTGIDLQLNANMELWRAPATSPSVVTLAQRLGLTEESDDSSPFLIDFIADALSEAMQATLPTGRVLLANNKLEAVAAVDNPSAFALTFVSSTGAFNGTFKVVIPPATKPLTVAFSGNLRQPLSGDLTSALIGQGYFLLPGATSADPQTSGQIRFERLVP